MEEKEDKEGDWEWGLPIRKQLAREVGLKQKSKQRFEKSYSTKASIHKAIKMASWRTATDENSNILVASTPMKGNG